jgi:hypothetical protein
MTKIQIQTTKDEFIIELTGTQEKPIIQAEKHILSNGVCIQGFATVQHWKHKGAQPGLYFNIGGVYVQCPEGIETIKKEIMKLPEEKKFAWKELEKITSDGSITVEKWNFDCPMWDSNGELISDADMERFLDKQGIKEIEIDEAIKLYENRPLRKNTNNKYNAQFQFETDEIEEGYIQACENAGIPGHLR